MTAARLREILDQIGWSRRELARQTGRHERTVRRWTSGECVMPRDVADWIDELAVLFRRLPRSDHPTATPHS